MPETDSADAHCARIPGRSEQRRGASPTRTHGQVGREKQEIRAVNPAQNKVMILLEAEHFRPVLFHSILILSRRTGKKRHPFQQLSQKNHRGRTVRSIPLRPHDDLIIQKMKFCMPRGITPRRHSQTDITFSCRRDSIPLSRSRGTGAFSERGKEHELQGETR